MNLDLKNRRVLVAGASRGIGLAMARAFLAEGCKVILIARGEEALLRESKTILESIESDDRIMTFAMDAANSNDWALSVQKIEESWGKLDIVIANVGDGRGSQIALSDREQFEEAWRVNFRAAEETARATIPILSEGGVILFVSSIAGLEAIGAPTTYSVAKAAVLALAKQLSRRLAPSVRVNVLVPGNVMFEGSSWQQKRANDLEGVDSLIERTVPMGCFGTPEQMADAALFLCSDRASFITGTRLVVDGGQMVSL